MIYSILTCIQSLTCTGLVWVIAYLFFLAYREFPNSRPVTTIFCPIFVILAIAVTYACVRLIQTVLKEPTGGPHVQ